MQNGILESYPTVDVGMVRRLAGELDFGRFFEQAATEAARVVGADGCALIEVKGDGTLCYSFFQGLPENYRRLASNFRFRADKGTAGVVLAEGKPIFTSNYERSDHAMPEFVEAGLKANWVIPIGPADDRRAVLAIAWFGQIPTVPPSAQQTSIILLLADLIYGALYRQSLEADLSRQAQHDVLTGLPNRRFLIEHLKRALPRVIQTHKSVAVLALDLDGFKPVNDLYGHSAGDLLLQQLAARLTTALRGQDFVARLGGDEFVLVLENIVDTNGLIIFLERLRVMLDVPYEFSAGVMVTCGASIGVTLYPQDMGDANDLLRHADRALYAAKSDRKIAGSRWNIFNRDENGSMREGDKIAALVPSHIEILYQPIFDLQLMRVVRLEALVRLNNDGQLLLPSDFLSLLSVTKHRDLFSTVLNKVLEQLTRWDIDKTNWPGVSVNVEPQLLIYGGLSDIVMNALRTFQIHPGRLTLEILESGEFLSQDTALSQLVALRAMGVRLAIDDLGTGYASLLRLRKLPIQEIKLDQDFVRDLTKNIEDIAFVLSIQELAHGLDLELVAEGAETFEVLDVLRAVGIRYTQGFGVCYPVPAAEIPTAINTLMGWRNTPSADPLIIAYSRHLMMDAYLLGLLRCAPQDLDSEIIRNVSFCPLTVLLKDMPDAAALHNQQHGLLADMVHHADQNLHWPVKRYKALSANLRHILVGKTRMKKMETAL